MLVRPIKDFNLICSSWESQLNKLHELLEIFSFIYLGLDINLVAFSLIELNHLTIFVLFKLIVVHYVILIASAVLHQQTVVGDPAQESFSEDMLFIGFGLVDLRERIYSKFDILLFCCQNCSICYLLYRKISILTHFPNLH